MLRAEVLMRPRVHYCCRTVGRCSESDVLIIVGVVRLMMNGMKRYGRCGESDDRCCKLTPVVALIHVSLIATRYDNVQISALSTLHILRASARRSRRSDSAVLLATSSDLHG